MKCIFCETNLNEQCCDHLLFVVDLSFQEVKYDRLEIFKFMNYDTNSIEFEELNEILTDVVSKEFNGDVFSNEDLYMSSDEDESYSEMRSGMDSLENYFFVQDLPDRSLLINSIEEKMIVDE